MLQASGGISYSTSLRDRDEVPAPAEEPLPLRFSGSSLGLSMTSSWRMWTAVVSVVSSSATLAAYPTMPEAPLHLVPTVPDEPESELPRVMVGAVLDPDLQRILGMLEEQPIEDGMNHPAEEHLAALASAGRTEGIVRAIESGSLGSARTAALLRLVGRTEAFPRRLREGLVSVGLGSNDTGVRDAAIQAVETWGDARLLPLLRGHAEPVGWLAEYQARVLADLGE